MLHKGQVLFRLEHLRDNLRKGLLRLLLVLMREGELLGVIFKETERLRLEQMRDKGLQADKVLIVYVLD